MRVWGGGRGAATHHIRDCHFDKTVSQETETNHTLEGISLVAVAMRSNCRQPGLWYYGGTLIIELFIDT